MKLKYMLVMLLRRSGDSKGIVLEVVIKNASKFLERGEEGWYDASDKGQFARNHRKDMEMDGGIKSIVEMKLLEI